MAIVKANKIPKLIRVKMLKDFQVDERMVAKKGKYGAFDEDVARKMIKEKAAEEIVTVNSISEILHKKPYIEVEQDLNPTQEKQKEADKALVKVKKKTKEQKFKL